MFTGYILTDFYRNEYKFFVMREMMAFSKPQGVKPNG